MTDSDKLDKLVSDVATLTGKVDAQNTMQAQFLAMTTQNENHISKVSGRINGISVMSVVAILLSFAALALVKFGPQHLTQAAREVVAALLQ